MTKDILDDLEELRKQATEERSHYYVKSCVERAIIEIRTLRILAKGVAEAVAEFRESRRS